MTNVSEWSVTAGSNNSSPPDGWPEGMARSAVNDCAREMMAALAKWYKDQLGTLTTAGGTTAYTLTTNSVHAALSDIPLMAIKANATNTGAVTLNVDGLGAKSLTKQGGTALVAGDFVTAQVYVVAFNLASDRFEIAGSGLATDAFATGTLMLFQQTAAPTGWTKQVTHNNKALRVVTGTASSGGSTAFTSVFASRTLLQANLPSYSLSHTLTLPDHGHSATTTLTNGTGVLRNAVIDQYATAGINALASATTSTITASTSIGSVTSSPAISGGVTSGGSGTAIDFAVQYVDLIIAAKA